MDSSVIFKRGDPHPVDATLFFWGMDRRYSPPERWVTSDALSKRRISKYLNRKKYFDQGYRNPGRLLPEAKKRRYAQYLIWLSKNREKAYAATKAWRDNNPEKAKAGQKRWAVENRNKRLEGLKRWRAENPGLRRTYGAARRARVKKPKDPVENAKIVFIYRFCALLNQRHLKWAPKGMFNVDHVKPLSKGGEHLSSNLRVTTAAFNRSKYNKTTELL